MKVVEIVWHDAWIDVNDLTIKKACKLKPVKRSTVGYLVKEKKNCYVLSTDRFYKEKEISAPMVIPKGMVLEYLEYERP